MLRLRYAILDDYSSSNTFAKRTFSSVGGNGHMGMGCTRQEWCFCRRSGKSSEHVDMARALCENGRVLLGAGFLLSLDIPL